MIAKSIATVQQVNLTNKLIKEKIAHSLKKGLFAVFYANNQVRDG